MSGNRSIAEVKFHSNSTSPSVGLEYMITSDASTINIAFMGSETFLATIEGKVSYESEWNEINAVDLKTLNVTTQPNTFNTWQADVVGWSYIRVKLVSVTGTVTAIGRLVG
jgi:hypothetical protein